MSTDEDLAIYIMGSNEPITAEQHEEFLAEQLRIRLYNSEIIPPRKETD